MARSVILYRRSRQYLHRKRHPFFSSLFFSRVSGVSWLYVFPCRGRELTFGQELPGSLARARAKRGYSPMAWEPIPRRTFLPWRKREQSKLKSEFFSWENCDAMIASELQQDKTRLLRKQDYPKIGTPKFRFHKKRSRKTAIHSSLVIDSNDLTPGNRIGIRHANNGDACSAPNITGWLKLRPRPKA